MKERREDFSNESFEKRKSEERKKIVKDFLKIEQGKMKFDDVMSFQLKIKKKGITTNYEKRHSMIELEFFDKASDTAKILVSQDKEYRRIYEEKTGKMKVASLKICQREYERVFQEMFLKILDRGGKEELRQAYEQSIVMPLREEITRLTKELDRLREERLQIGTRGSE